MSRCKHEHCHKCEAISLPARSSDWYVCCRCRELKRRDRRAKKSAPLRARGRGPEMVIGAR